MHTRAPTSSFGVGACTKAEAAVVAFGPFGPFGAAGRGRVASWVVVRTMRRQRRILLGVRAWLWGQAGISAWVA